MNTSVVNTGRRPSGRARGEGERNHFTAKREDGEEEEEDLSVESFENERAHKKQLHHDSSNQQSKSFASKASYALIGGEAGQGWEGVVL
jgi:hypothetical protein